MKLQNNYSLGILLVVLLALSPVCWAAGQNPAKVVAYWTKERRRSAVPREIKIDATTGNVSIRGPADFVPYGLAKKDVPGGRNLRSHHGSKHRRMHDVTIADVSSGEHIAVGRLFFELNGLYSCSATAVTGKTDESKSSRSIIVTAGHCAYDERGQGKFASNVMFIPGQDETTGDSADRDCTNDPIGCWVPDFAVVHANYKLDAWWRHDIAAYVVNLNDEKDSHFSREGDNDISIADALTGISSEPFQVDFTAGQKQVHATALGYPGYGKKSFQYCEDNIGFDGSDNFFLPVCKLGGGSSGGPWVVDGDTKLFTVNSYGYDDRDGMGSTRCEPRGTDLGTCQCIWDTANDLSINGNIAVSCDDEGSECLPRNAVCPSEPQQCCKGCHSKKNKCK